MPHGDFASLPRGSESKASFATGVEDALVLCKGDALARSEAEAACGLMELSTGVTVPQSYVDQLASMYLRGVPDDPREVNALQASWEQHLEKVKERKQAADVRAETVMRKGILDSFFRSEA